MKARRFGFTFRTAFWALAGLALVVLLVIAFQPRPISVDTAEVTRGPLEVTIRDEARTRIPDIYVVSAPVGGRLLRVGDRAGEEVERGQVIAIIQPGPPIFVDERTRQEVRAAVRSAAAALALGRAELQRAEARLAHARLEAGRTETLFSAGVAPRTALDRARLELRTATTDVDTARARVGVRSAELDAARTQLTEPSDTGVSARSVTVRAPVGGRILRVLQESESIIGQGAPVMEIGDPTTLEIVAELLTSDAVKVRPGAPVRVDAWDGETAFRGRVRQVEPYGFLKISALGVEEQRVNVIIDPVDPPPAWAAVGHGYRVETAITVSTADAAVRAPVAALFRHRKAWAVFRIADGRARLTPVEVGPSDGELAQVRSGLRVGDRVVLHPGRSITDGDRVRARENR
jgi:HlyD family secretion protein